LCCRVRRADTAAACSVKGTRAATLETKLFYRLREAVVGARHGATVAKTFSRGRYGPQNARACSLHGTTEPAPALPACPRSSVLPPCPQRPCWPGVRRSPLHRSRRACWSDRRWRRQAQCQKRTLKRRKRPTSVTACHCGSVCRHGAAGRARSARIARYEAQPASPRRARTPCVRLHSRDKFLRHACRAFRLHATQQRGALKRASFFTCAAVLNLALHIARHGNVTGHG